MDTNKLDVFRLGKGFELGLVSFESLSESQKYDLSRYFAMKSNMIDNKIAHTTNELNAINNKLDSVYNELMEMNK